MSKKYITTYQRNYRDFFQNSYQKWLKELKNKLCDILYNLVKIK